MAKQDKNPKNFEINLDTKNVDIKVVRDVENDRTLVIFDSKNIDITYDKHGKATKIIYDSKNLDIEFTSDESGTSVEVDSKINWLGKVVQWMLTRKIRRAIKKSKK